MNNPGWFNTALRSAVSEAVPLYPLLLIFSVYVIEISPYLLWCAFALSVLCGGIAALRLRREPAYLASAGLPILIALSVGFAQPHLSVGQIFCLLILLLIGGGRGVYRELRIPPSSRAETLAAAAWLAAGVILYRISFSAPPLKDYSFSIYLFTALTLALLLLRWNTRRVRESQGLSASESMPINQLLYANRGLTAVLLLLILGVGAVLPLSNPFGGIQRAQQPSDLPAASSRLNTNEDPFDMCAMWYKQAKERADKEGKEVSYDQLPDECQPLVPDAGNEADDGSYGWLDWAAAVVISLFILGIVYYVLRLLYILFAEWLPDWLKKLLANLRITAGLVRSAEDQAYLDTTEKIEPHPAKKPRTAASFAEPGEGPRRDYFRLVREAVRKGYSFRPSLTPSETGREIAAKPDYRELERSQVEELIERYNRTRYAEKQSRTKTD